MKKGYVFVLFAIIISILIINSIQTALSYETEETAIPQAYKWLINHTKNKWDSLTIKQDSFSLLALSCNSTYSKQGNKSLLNLSYYSSNSSSGKIRCWKESGKATSSSQCKLVETSLAKLALNELGGNTSAVDTWLLSNKRVFTTGIYWFLQIDIARGKEAYCEVMYSNQMQNVSIHADKTVSINGVITPNACVESVFRNYWFKLKQSEECYGNEYLIKCFGNESTADPVTANLLYRNNTNDPRTSFFVSSEISQGTLGFINQLGEEEQTPGIMELNTPSYCLANPSDPAGTCDYEGTAWATYVWNKEGKEENVNLFLPYLIVYSSFNEKYFPETFLSTLVGSEYTEEILKEEQRLRKPQSNDYWSFWLNQPLLYGQFYDTPLAVLSLGTSVSNVSENKDYLLGHIARDYSWVNTFDAAPNPNTHRDTAFILWVFWPNYCPGFEEGPVEPNDCEAQGIFYKCKESCDANEIPWSIFSCPDYLTCCSNVTGGNQDECLAKGGECLNEITCPGGYGQFNDVTSCSDGGICCKEFGLSHCDDWQGGNICEIGFSCPAGQSKDTLDGACCLSQCTEDQFQGACNYDICGIDELCWNYNTQGQVDFIPSLEERCCPSFCVKDRDCKNVGEDCSALGPEYNCVDSSGGLGQTQTTKDNEECCLDDCKKGCVASQICDLGQTCENGQWDLGSIEPTCCLSKCKNKSSSSWIWIIILIVIVIIGVLAYFFFFKKKKEGEEIDEFTGLPKEDSKSGKGKDDFDMAAFSAFPKQNQGQKSQFPQKNQQRNAPKPMSFNKPAIKPVSTTKRTTTVKETTINKETSSGKTKAEQELEATLGKLKNLTKKK